MGRNTPHSNAHLPLLNVTSSAGVMSTPGVNDVGRIVTSSSVVMVTLERSDVGGDATHAHWLYSC